MTENKYELKVEHDNYMDIARHNIKECVTFLNNMNENIDAVSKVISNEENIVKVDNLGERVRLHVEKMNVRKNLHKEYQSISSSFERLQNSFRPIDEIGYTPEKDLVTNKEIRDLQDCHLSIQKYWYDLKKKAMDVIKG